MRKLLIGTLIIVLMVLAVYMLIDKVSLGKIEILGIQAIVDKNDALDQKIVDTTKLSTVTYQSKLNSLEEANKSLQAQKETYENYLLSDNGSNAINQIQSYEVEYLWTKIGNYAKREGVVLKMDVEVNNAVLKTYNLNFTVTGTYVGITEFIYDIDNDSSLLFKVDEFKLVPGVLAATQNSSTSEGQGGNSSTNQGTTTNTLVATFKCKDISINIDSSAVSKINNAMNAQTLENNGEAGTAENNAASNNTTGNGTNKDAQE